MKINKRHEHKYDATHAKNIVALKGESSWKALNVGKRISSNLQNWHSFFKNEIKLNFTY